MAQTFEQAAFRVQDRAFFVSDTDKLIADIRSFKCLEPRSILLRGVKLDKVRLKPLGPKKVDLSKKRQLIEQIIDLLVVSRFVQERERSTLPEQSNRRCVNGTMSSDLKALLRSEIFFADRFLRNKQRTDLKTVRTFISGLKKKSDYEIFD